MADDGARSGPVQKLSWSVLRKGSASANDGAGAAGGGAGDGGESPKVAPTSGPHPMSRPTSLGATSFRGGITRAPSNAGLGLMNGGATGSLASKEHGNLSGALATRSHSVVHAGLLAPGQGNGTTADVVTAVKDLQQRKRSIMFHHATSQTGPSLQTRTGSLSTYFFAPNPTPGKGVCFSPDGTYVMRWGYGTDVKLLSADDGMLVVTMVAPTPGAVRYATFNSDGGKVAVATEDCKVYVWVTANKHLMCTLDVGAEPLAHVVFSQDSKHLLSCDDEGQLELWSIAQATMVRRYETGHISKRCGFSADGESVLSCAGDDCGLLLLSTRTGAVQVTQQFEEVAESRNRASYIVSPDGNKVLLFILEQVYGINLVLYHIETDTHIPLMVCDGAVTHADFSNDSSLFITAGRDDLIHVWESDTGMLRTTLQGHASDVMFCKISEEGEVAISGDSEGTVLVWSLTDGACVMKLQAHSCPIAYVDVNADGTRALTVDTEGHALLWFLDAARAFEVLRQHSDLVSCTVPTPDGTSLVVGYKDGCLRCWNISDGPGFAANVMWTHTKQTCPIEQLAMRSDGGQVAAAGRDGTVVITDMRRGVVTAILNAHSDFVTGLLFGERSDLLVSASRVGEVSVWNAKTYGNEPIRCLTVPELLEVAALAISPHQTNLAAATAGGTVHIWNLTTFHVQADVKVTDLPATRITFNSDGSVLAVAAADGGVTLIDPITGMRAAHYRGNASSITDVAFMVKPEHILLSLCGRQAITWDCHKSAQQHVTDFIADGSRIFASESIGVLANRTCVAHDAVVLHDPINHAAMYDMLPRPPEQHPGNSYLFRQGTTLTAGPNGYPMVLFCAPDTTVRMMSDESSGTRCLDFSSDGRLLVSGNLRGELVVWDVVHQQQMQKWVAHKRSAITCVRFTHDATAVYSCAEDCKVIMWDWRRQTKLAVLTGHQAPVAAVEMSVDGDQMASGDRDGFIFIWDTHTHAPKQVIPAHDGAVLCCSLSPCGTMVASTGADEHIVMLDVHTGQQLASLDDAMDGKGLTIKFSFDGTRLLVGGEKGAVLIWDVARNCLLYDIPAHDGKVFDCGWSGDSRRLLSVGSDGRARLWDAAAGSELCQANFDRVMGTVESGGFLHCDLSATGNRMAGCTAKGQLIDWDVGAELRCVPEGSMLYQRLSALSLGRSREIYSRLLRQFPLLPNTQDSRGWTILMHAVANSNPEITKLIIFSVPGGTGKLGLTASAVQNTILSSIRHVPRIQMLASSGATSGKGMWEGGSKRMSISNAEGAISATSVTKLSSHKNVGPTGRNPSHSQLLMDKTSQDEEEDDDDSSGDGSGPKPSPPPQLMAAPHSPPANPGTSLLGRVGTFLRSGAELLSPPRERTSAPGDMPVSGGGAASVSSPSPAPTGAREPAEDKAAEGGGPSSAPRSPGRASLLYQAEQRITPPSPVATTATSRFAGVVGAPASSSSQPSPLGTARISPAARTSILKNVALQSAGTQSSIGSGNTSNPGTGAGATAGASPVGAAVGGSVHGGSVHGGNANNPGQGARHHPKSLLGSVLAAERVHDMTRSRRRSFVFGSPLLPIPAPTAPGSAQTTGVTFAGGGSGGGGGGSGGTSHFHATSNFGRSIRHAVHKLARVGSRGHGSRDLEDGMGEDGVELRHVSDLGRSIWQDDDQDGKGPPVNKDGGLGGRGGSKVWPLQEPSPLERTEPNVVKIALDAGAADCVQHVLDAVLAQKVTPGSYHAITQAIPAVAQQYPTMCQVFLSGLPLRPLGEMEVPSSIAARGMIVTSAPSYTSYKEMWMNELQLQGGNKGPMALMEACMVRLPFAAASGKQSVLHTLVESGVPVQTFGSDTVKAIVDYKWRNFAQRRIYIKALVYLLYTVIFTVFAVLFADHDSQASITGLYETGRGIAIVAFSAVLFLYGAYFLVLEIVQLVSLGASAYFDSFWNLVDIAAYVTTLIVCPCTVFRYGLDRGQFVAVLVAAEVIMLWVKVLFYGLAIDGVGTFIFMTAEIIKGLKYFIGLLATLFISFAVAFMVLFRNEPDVLNDGGQGLGDQYGSFGNSLLNVYLVMFQQIADPHDTMASEYGHFAIFLFCVYMFTLLVVMLNMIITLMADIYQKVKGIQHFVFLKGRAELIIDVESTSGGGPANLDNHPYLHLLMPLRKDGTSGASGTATEITASLVRNVSGAAGGGGGGAVGAPGGGGGQSSRAVSQTGGGGGGRSALAEPPSDSESDDDDARSNAGGRALSRMASFKSTKSTAPVTRRQTDAYSSLGAMTMVRRPGGATTTGGGGVDTERLERLERAVNRLATNLDNVITHLKVRQPSTTGGGGGLGGGLGGGVGVGSSGAALMAADVAAMVSPLGRRAGAARSTTGVGAISMVVRGSRSVGDTLGFGLPGSIVSRAASRPTSAMLSGSPSPLPLLPMLNVTTSAARPGSGPQPGPTQGTGSSGAHAHLHATFADEAGHDQGAVAPRSAAPASPGGGSGGAPAASARVSTSGVTAGGLAGANLGSGRALTPEASFSPAAAGPGSTGNALASSGSAISSGGKRRSLIAEALPASSILEGDENVERMELDDPVQATLPPLPGASRAATITGDRDAPRLGSRGSAAEGGSGEAPSSRSGNSPAGGPGGGGVATAARLVLDPEEKQPWNGSGPGRPSGSLSGAEPPRIRTPGEVEPSA